jgi:NADPH-dependent curcumin reductase CurA
MTINRQILLAKRPTGWVTEADFRLVESPVPVPGDGQVLIRNHYLSLDPYMRGRMDDAPSYAENVKVGDVMVGGTVGEVVESKNPKFTPGMMVSGYAGWQDYGLSDGKMLSRIDTSIAPASWYLGVLGMPGVTAWIGLLDICQPKAGETVVVSAASGAVGSVVGQLARIAGCRVVGIAGGPEKCGYCVNDLGFDACVDYKSDGWRKALSAAAPKGIDVNFENVGGEVLDAVLSRTNAFARVALCGLVSQYNATEAYGVKNFRFLLVNRIRLQGFIVSEHLDKWPRALQELAGHVSAGRIKYRETVADGLENAPSAFIGMLQGRNFGKQVVKLV